MVDLPWQLSFDVHKGLEQDLLLHKLKFLLFVVMLQNIYLLEGVETLARFELELSAEDKQELIKGGDSFGCREGLD